MAMSKEQRRKIYGIREPKDPADPSVTTRRHLHEMVVRWELKWLGAINLLSFIFALAFILLPALIKSWKAIVERIPILTLLNQLFTTPNIWLTFIFVFGVGCHIYSSSKIDGNNYSHHHYPINLKGVRSPQQVIDMELYPASKIEERVFWVDFIGGVWLSIFFWFGILGGFVMLLNLRGA
jgi:hypothetical protein